MFRGARLGGFPTLEQLYSSVVIAKDTSSMILPGALECASAGEPPHQHQHVEGRPEEDGCVGQVVQEVVVTLLRAKKETMN